MSIHPDVDPSKKIFGDATLDVLEVGSYSDIHVLNDWEQKGAETFVMDFILNRDGKEEHLMAKACIKFFASDIVREWMVRRQQLQDNGVSMPNLVAVQGATFVEEFIPYTFSEAVNGAEGDRRHQLEQSYIDTYARIFGAGFKPISLHDLRSRGSDTVAIDVGFDLGPAAPIDRCDVSTMTDAVRSLARITHT